MRKNILEVHFGSAFWRRWIKIDQILVIHRARALLRSVPNSSGPTRTNELPAMSRTTVRSAQQRGPAQKAGKGMTESNVAKLATSSRICCQCCCAEFQQQEEIDADDITKADLRFIQKCINLKSNFLNFFL